MVCRREEKERRKEGRDDREIEVQVISRSTFCLIIIILILLP